MSHGLKQSFILQVNPHIIRVYLVILLARAAHITEAVHLMGAEEYAIQGRPYTLICDTKDRPTRMVDFWDNSNDRLISSITVNKGQCTVSLVNHTEICDPNICSCINNGDGLGFEFMWTTVIDSSNPSSTWACLSEFGEYYLFTIKIKVPVSSVNIQQLNGFNTLTLEESKGLTLTCVSKPCRPAAAIFWYIGGDNYTSYSVNEVVKEDEKYTTTSNLTITPTRRLTGKRIKCTGRNIENETIESIQQPLLNVNYAPAVNIRAKSVTEGDTDVELVCEAKGEPNTYQFGSWVQTYGSTTIRNLLTSQENLIITPGMLKFQKVTFEDIGTYSCEVQNGIIGRNDKLVQTGSTFFNVTALPKIPEASKSYVWLEKEPFTLTLGVVSNPDVLYMEFKRCLPYRKISNSSLMWVSYTESLVYVSLHGKNVPMPGYRAELNVFNFSSDVAGRYLLNVTNSIGTTVHVFSLVLQHSSTTGIFSKNLLEVMLIVVSAVIIIAIIVAIVCMSIRHDK